jgi:hypothetical protein
MKNGMLATALALLVAACVTRPTLPLPTLASYNGGCRGVGLEATLAGSRTDPRVAWLLGAGGSRQEIIWPPGFTARFDPNLAVLDADGEVVYRAGDRIEGGCVAGTPDDPGLLLITPPGS